MNHRERIKAVMRYEKYDRLPVVCFGYWEETFGQWVAEGHLRPEDIEGVADSNEVEHKISQRLGFDYNYYNIIEDTTQVMGQLYPMFEEEVLETLSNGQQKFQTYYGVVELRSPGAQTIRAVVDTLLKDRKSWEELFKPKLQFCEERLDHSTIKFLEETEHTRDRPQAIYGGSLLGQVRNMLTLEGMSYLMFEDEELFDEICDTILELNIQNAQRMMETKIGFDYVFFWEDIAFKNGPLINPKTYYDKFGPRYKKLTDIFKANGIDIISLDCDGKVDSLVPTWLDHGINTLFPIEIGTWGASIAPFREEYGKSILGVGGMNKHVFAQDRAAIDREIERLKPLVALGGYVPCPDHRIPPESKFELIQYYTEQMRKTFG